MTLAGTPISAVGKPDMNRYWGLDAMRGVAAMIVMIGHLQHRYAASSLLAVDFFYLLSGFIIAKMYEDRLKNGLGAMAFMRIRVRRLYPLFVVGILLGTAQLGLMVATGKRIVGPADFLLSFANNIFMLPTPTYLLWGNDPALMQGLYPLDGPAWSIFWEMLVNAAFAVLLFRLALSRLMVIVAVSLTGLVWAVLAHQSLNIGWEWPSVEGGLFRVAFSFTLGMILYRLKIGTRRTVNLGALFPIALLGVVLLIPLPDTGHARIAFDLLFIILLSPMFVIAGAMVELPPRFVPLGRILGYASYPVYILHRSFTDIFHGAAEHFHLPMSVTCLLFLAFIFPFAISVSLLVDQAMRKGVMTLKIANWRTIVRPITGGSPA